MTDHRVSLRRGAARPACLTMTFTREMQDATAIDGGPPWFAERISQSPREFSGRRSRRQRLSLQRLRHGCRDSERASFLAPMSAAGARTKIDKTISRIAAAPEAGRPHVRLASVLDRWRSRPNRMGSSATIRIGTSALTKLLMHLQLLRTWRQPADLVHALLRGASRTVACLLSGSVRPRQRVSRRSIRSTI